MDRVFLGRANLSPKFSMLRSETFLLFIICLVDFCFLSYAISTLSISYYEADAFYNSPKISAVLARFSVEIFGQNDYALRLPFVICHIFSVALLYKVSKQILKRKFDRVVSAVVFILLPATMASAILVNDAGIIIALSLLSIYLYQLRKMLAFFALLCVLPFVSGAFLVYFSAIFAFGVYRRDARMAWVAALLFALCFYFYGFNSGGKPSGHLLDTVSIFAAAFSPFIFVYFVYAMYRIWIKEAKNLLWFVCITAFLFCLVLSIRQRLELENYLPFCVISVPILVRVFFSSYRVRLPMFRRGYKILASFAVASLLAGFLFVLFNETLYGVLKDPTKHFVYRYHVAKELAKELKDRGIEKIFTDDKKLALRLKFYGIDTSEDADLRLLNLSLSDNYDNIAVNKFGKKIARFKLKER